MQIEPHQAMLQQLWYENVNGEKWFPPPSGPIDPPEGYTYQHSRFACEVRHDVLEGSKKIASTTTTYHGELVLALARPSWAERALQIARYGSVLKPYGFQEAVLLATLACERCTNALLHRTGAGAGYAEGSKEWNRAGTRCGLCEQGKMVLP